MLALLLNHFVLVSACVAIHTVGMFGSHHLWPRPDGESIPTRTFGLIVSRVYGLLSLHLLQINVWVAFYQMRKRVGESRADH